MVRGRTPSRGTRRGAAAAGGRAPTESGDGSAASGATDTPTSSVTPVPAPAAVNSTRSTPGLSTRGGTATRATRGPAVGRFRPKNIRRDESERDNLARQEEEKANVRAAEERRARGRSRFRSKRSRGDAMGARGGMARTISGASGPFSSGTAGRSGGGGWSGGAGGGGGFRGSSSFAGGVKSESKSGFAQADSSRYRETRINADKLNVIAPEEEYDSEDEAMMAALSSRTASVLPMGIYRREHKDTGVVVATTAELEAAENATGEEESLWVDGDDAAPPTVVDQPEDGVWETDSKQPVVIKKEPGSDEMDLDTKDTSKTPEAEPERKPATEGKPKKVLPQDPEEKMIQSDLDLLAHELGNVTVTENGETRTEEPANKDGRMYLFQFPPLLPPLKQVAAPAPVSSKVKAEPEDAGMVDLTALAPNPTAVDLTQEEANDEDSGDEDEDEDPEDKAGFMSQLMSQGGMVGKLNVRKSGKVELDWGGRILEMSPAVGMNFLSSAVIVEENDEKPKAGVVGGESIGMGKIMGRFVLAPTWDEEEDWEVSPEELRTD